MQTNTRLILHRFCTFKDCHIIFIKCASENPVLIITTLFVLFGYIILYIMKFLYFTLGLFCTTLAHPQPNNLQRYLQEDDQTGEPTEQQYGNSPNQDEDPPMKADDEQQNNDVQWEQDNEEGWDNQQQFDGGEDYADEQVDNNEQDGGQSDFNNDEGGDQDDNLQFDMNEDIDALFQYNEDDEFVNDYAVQDEYMINQIDKFDEDQDQFQIDGDQQLEPQQQDYQPPGPYDYLLDQLDQQDQNAAQSFFNSLLNQISTGSANAQEQQTQDNVARLYNSLFGQVSEGGAKVLGGVNNMKNLFSYSKANIAEEYAQQLFGQWLEG